jgi:hypothetical protein
MRCLTPKETAEIFSKAGFSVSTAQEWYRTSLVLEPKISARQRRIGGRPPPLVTRLPQFSEALNRWLPSNQHRLLWIAHFNRDFPNTYALFIAARVGLGETRSLSEAPGHYFDPFEYHEQDQLLISPEQAQQTSILVGLMSLIMINGWDGCLIADDSVDRIEFWEGNILLYSEEELRLGDATSLMTQFDCPRDLG